MAFTMSRVDRVYRTYSVVATNEDGVSAAPGTVDFTLVPVDTISPGAGSTWTAGTLVGNEWRIMLAGPDADQTGAIAVPSWGGDLWLRVIDNPEVIAVKVDRITVGS